MTPEEVVDRSRPISGLQVFAIGVKEQGVTVASQQRRAMHLVDALIKTGTISAGSAVAVVGAGAAGLSASVRAAHAGCDVLLLERNAEVLSTFRGCHSRLLHPNLYRWPENGWNKRDAEVGPLSWRAATAANVARGIAEQFYREVQRTGLIEVACSTVVEWDREALKGPLPALSWRRVKGDRNESRRFAAILLAVGFGRERQTGTEYPGYWQNDDTDQSMTTLGLKYFIQGAGDGGLTDLLRVRIKAFDQATFFERVLAQGTAQQIRNLEDDVRRAEKKFAGNDGKLDAFYRELKVAWLEEALHESGFRPHTVTLNDTRPAFGSRRFPLNKLLVSRLLKMRDGGCEWFQGVVRRNELEVTMGMSVVRYHRVLLRCGNESEIDALGSEFGEGSRLMTQRGSDTGDVPLPELPPRASSAKSCEALAHAILRCRSLADIVRTLLLYLRHAGRSATQLSDDAAFEKLAASAYLEIKQQRIGMWLGHASDVAAFAASFLSAHSNVSCDVVARALAEALDGCFAHRIVDSLRGIGRAREFVDVRGNALHPRIAPAHDLEGRMDGGLSSVALVPSSGQLKLRLVWTRDAWPTRPRVILATPLASMDHLRLTSTRKGEFFGAVASDPRTLSSKVDTLIDQLQKHTGSFVLLPEFTLHGDLGNLCDACERLNCNLFAGIGHVEIADRQIHQRVAKLGVLPPTTIEKSDPSDYTAHGETWREDIHRGEPLVLGVVSADGRALVVLAGPDGWSTEAVELSGQLHPLAVLSVARELPRPLLEQLKAKGIGVVLADPKVNRANREGLVNGVELIELTSN